MIIASASELKFTSRPPYRPIAITAIAAGGSSRSNALSWLPIAQSTAASMIASYTSVMPPRLASSSMTPFIHARPMRSISWAAQRAHRIGEIAHIVAVAFQRGPALRVQALACARREPVAVAEPR